MKKQKICIIGGGLTGLITAITLSKLNIEIDLVVSDLSKNIISNRTIAISQNNYNFLKQLNIFKNTKTLFWPSGVMKLYSEEKNKSFKKLLEIDHSIKQKKKILYMTNSKKIMQEMIKYITKKKNITIKKNKKISQITQSNFLNRIKFTGSSSSYSNLIIMCTGRDSELIKKISKSNDLQYSYNEASFTTIIQHESINNNIVRQIFLDNEIFALLPISKNKTSIVLTVKKKIIETYKEKKQFLLKKNIIDYSKNFFKKVKLASNIESQDLSFFLKRKYFKDRILLFGDALHVVHPLAGQGFNMILRDLISLEKILKKKIQLGLDIGSSNALSEFSTIMQPRNLIYSAGIDFFKNFFTVKKNLLKEPRNKIVRALGKNKILKNVFFNLANEGFKF